MIESTLNKKPIPIAPSLFFVFKKDEEEQLFYKNRIKARALKQLKFVVIETSEDQSMSDEFVKIIMEKKELQFVAYPLLIWRNGTNGLKIDNSFSAIT